MAKLARKLKKGEIRLSKESKERMKKVVDFTPMTEQTMEDLINEWNDYIDKNMKFYPWWLDEKKRKPVCLDSLFGSEIEYKLNRAEQMADEYKRFNRKILSPKRKKINKRKIEVLSALAEETSNRDFAEKVYPVCLLHLEEAYQKIDKPLKEVYDYNKEKQRKYEILWWKLKQEEKAIGKEQRTKSCKEVDFTELYKEFNFEDEED